MNIEKEKAAMKVRNASVKHLTHEAMRDKISFTKTLTLIEGVEGTLREMVAEQGKEPSTARVGALRALNESYWRRIDKILPSLKAVEVTGGGRLHVSVTDLTGNARHINDIPGKKAK